MALTMTRTCDMADVDDTHQATSTAEITIGGVLYVMDICDQHLDALPSKLREIGFAPASVAVGHNRRAAYTTRSGRPFTTHEVRAWLRGQGEAVSDVGRLPAAALRAYAAAH